MKTIWEWLGENPSKKEILIYTAIVVGACMMLSGCATNSQHAVRLQPPVSHVDMIVQPPVIRGGQRANPNLVPFHPDSI